jgi:hypothetical protein
MICRLNGDKLEDWLTSKVVRQIRLLKIYERGRDYDNNYLIYKIIGTKSE